MMQAHVLEAIRDAFRGIRAAWRELVLTDIVCRIAAIVLLGPLLGLLAALFLTSTADRVVTDAAIVAFLLSPIGLAALLVLGALVFGVLFAEVGALMVISLTTSNGRPCHWHEAVCHVLRRAPALVELAGVALMRLLALAAPFLIAVVALYWALLTDYDINYYLAERPPRFVAVVCIAAVLVIVLVWLLARRLAAWILALPIALFEGTPGRKALRSSEASTAGHVSRLGVFLVAWVAGVTVAALLVTALIAFLGGLVIPATPTDVALVAAAFMGMLLISGLANLAVHMLATLLFPLIVARIYTDLRGTPLTSVVPAHARRWRLPAGGRLLGGAVVALLATAAAGYLLLRAVDSRDVAVIIAHRGGATVAPENTHAAFTRAIADGADWLELDVQETAEGVIVVEHDRDFMRAAGVPLEVADATADALAQIDIGRGFGLEFSGERVPLLRNVLELAKDRARVLIELKYYGRDENLEARVVDLVEAAGMTAQVAIMSLDYAGVRKMAALRPEWRYGLLNSVSLGDVTKLDLDFLALNAAVATNLAIRRAQRAGLDVYVWTINDPVQMSIMLSRGVDGVITDDVELARSVLDFRAQLTPVGRLFVWLAGEAGLLRRELTISSQDDA